MENIGQILKSKRLEKNLSLKEIADRTKIRTNILEAIEADDTTIVPSVYYKSFLQTYCDFLNINLSQFSNTYSSNQKDKEPKASKKLLSFTDEIDGGLDKAIQYDLEASNERPNPIGNIIIYVSIGLIVLAAAYFGIIQTFFDIKSDNDIVAFDEEAQNADSSGAWNSENKLFQSIKAPEPDSIRLVAKARGEAWVRIVIDGQRVEETYFKPGMKKQWAAKESFELTQGNVGAIEYYRNDALLEPFGVKGSVVRNIVITKSQLKNITRGAQDSIKALYYTKTKPKKKVQKRRILLEPANFDENFLKNRDD